MMAALAMRGLWMRVLATMAFSAPVMIASAFAQGAAWPNQRMRMIVPYAAGGTTDMLGRLAAEEISKQTGQQVIVENRTGAGGNTGTLAVARAAPDGATFGMVVNTTLTVNPHLYSSMGFDPLKDLVLAAVLGEAPQVVVVHKDVPAKTLGEFVALAKSKPGGLNYATAGAGSSNHLSALLLSRLAGIKMAHVPYRGAAPAVADLASGQVQMFSVGAAPVLGLVQKGDLRILAATTRTRMPQLPDVPTAAEAGFKGYESTTWFGIVAPAGTSTAVVERINAMMGAMVGREDVKKRFDTSLLLAWRYSIPELRKIAQDEHDLFGRIIREEGIKIN